MKVTNCRRSARPLLPSHCVTRTLNTITRHMAICMWDVFPLTDIQVRLFHHIMCTWCLWRPLLLSLLFSPFLNHCFSCITFGMESDVCASVIWGCASLVGYYYFSPPTWSCLLKYKRKVVYFSIQFNIQINYSQ